MINDEWRTDRIAELEIERRELVERLIGLSDGELGSMKHSSQQAGTMQRLEIVRGLLAECDEEMVPFDRATIASKHSKLAQDWAKVAVSARNSEADEAIGSMRAALRDDTQLRKFGGL